MGLFWLRDQEPSMVQFCKLKGRLYGCQACLSESNKQYLADRELQSKVKESQDNADKKETATDNWVQKKSESFTAKFKEELACIIDAGIHFKFGMFYTDVLSVTFHYDYNGSTFQTAYISDDKWSPDQNVIRLFRLPKPLPVGRCWRLVQIINAPTYQKGTGNISRVFA
jgi:hypothetical protein